MKKLLAFLAFILLFPINNCNAQIFNDFYNDVANNVSYDNLENDLHTFQDFGVKEVGTTANNETKDWIKSRYLDLGYTNIIEQAFTVSGNETNNLIITKEGSLYPNTYLIIDGHYDTTNGPGANDNGSGTVLILELARLLKDIETEYSIKFIHFSGEEDGLIGSQYYVNNTVIPEDLDISLVLNLDQIGGVNGMSNNTIICERDEDNNPSSNNTESAAATQTLANSIELYSSLDTEISYAYASDYIPFENNGEIITGLYEKNESPYTHGPNDIIANMDIDYLFQITKGTLGAALHFAIGIEELSLTDVYFNEEITIYPNPSNHSIHFSNLKQENRVLIYSILGQKISTHRVDPSNNLIDVSKLEKGVYFLKLSNSNKTFKIIKN